MPGTKNPTNSDILREIREIKDTLIQHGKDIVALKNRALAEDAADKAVQEYKQREMSLKTEQTRMDFLKQWSPLIAALTALIVAITQRL